ncbi:N-ethylammeline chlorohydrolase [Streptococcus pneumoniae]|uniref:hypothetical protein n=1 Tax=Streptococcus pneumoniae TaxID=1313 RepID=UPI0005DB25EA|nr:hypothetical protein [Streptococcus pneumoniae]CAG6068507.1 N-ethylammeline chlorohydrolase [Streptococcus pneumoniae]
MGLTKSAQNTSKHCFEVVDGTDKVSNHIRQGDVDGFEEIFEEYETKRRLVIVLASF